MSVDYFTIILCLACRKDTLFFIFMRIQIFAEQPYQSFTADAAYTLEKGYAYFQAASEINSCFDMPVQLYEANPAVQNVAGCVAVARGPVIYCLEEVDNGKNLHSLNLNNLKTVTIHH